MAVQPGINMLIKKAGTAIAGVQTAKVSFGATTIDITSSDDAGFRKLLNATTGQQFTITASGVEKGGVLASLWASPATSKYLTDVTFTIPTESAAGDVFTGDVVMTAFAITGEYKGAVMFDVTFESAGTWTAA